ncbi:hypothetical protein [Ruminococcus sp. 5_1_39BFAA]|uniref:hypothetical protein n=1 Tax=Ruminococcus sp. 5_1_39BFAA TaxID=457412 RepID=UPI0035653B85
MKKLIALCICSCLAFTMTGCTLGDMIKEYINEEDSAEQETATAKHRVYMDEITGTLLDFTGSQLTVQGDEQTYVFDVSQATLECQDGMITGDEISVIYEGQLSDTDTSSVKALKVVDEFHNKNQLEERTAHGEVQSLTPNTITIKSKKGKTATYPITGTLQYYQNGIKPGIWVYIHFKGAFAQSEDETATVLNASHLKVLSISDIEPLTVPEPTPTPDPAQDTRQEKDKEKQLHAVIQNIAANVLTVLPAGSETTVDVDLSQIPVHFKGGAAPGSYVNISYVGELKDNTFAGITVTGVTGEDPDTMAERNMAFTVTGTISGSTANTITLQTSDGASVTCFTEGAQNYSTSGLAAGSWVRITFNPSRSKTSNIYTSIKIEDA